MNSSASFRVYNASAGSGKTFALVKAYLSEMLMNPMEGHYRHLLGITFTNKAVAEMKERIVNTLAALSQETVHRDFVGMQQLLISETSLSETDIRERSQRILKHLLHHYAQFGIETIDSFNHRLIRTFAHDLKLASNFEVSLDTDEILSKAVDQFIERAGTDEEVTQLLLEFALQKTDEDKSWDISFDLKKTASLLASENDLLQLQGLKDKSILDFRKLQKEILEKTRILQKEIENAASQLLELLDQNNIPQDVFQRGTFPNHFKKLKMGDYDVYKNKLEENLEVGGTKLYKAQTPEGIQQAIDALASEFLDAYRVCKKNVLRLKFYKNILKNLVPLAALNGVYQEVEQIKEEENILPINEFNSLIFSEIKDQPAPFIYERLGERYRHFFIDEFQDTSKLQWENLIPLIDNALSQTDMNGNTGSLLLVGDGKQSIYRWRGGLPEQFMELSKDANPFTADEKRVLSLGTNYRSAEEIIEFNNKFFSFVAPHFGDTTHQEMYKSGGDQGITNKKGGYVEIGFIEAKTKEEEHDVYPNKVLDTIHQLLTRGYEPKDICILTRRKKDGIIISEYLLEADPTLKLFSEETLLLKNSAVVNFLIALLHLTVDASNEEAKIQFLEYLYEHLAIAEVRHAFYAEHLPLSLLDLSEALRRQELDFDFEVLNQLPIFECLEYSISALQLEPEMDAFATGFMDLVFRFSQGRESGKVAFLEFWDTEKEKASLTSGHETNAIRLMTIHKSKGLEFPVVIFPYADVNIYAEIDPKTWYPWGENGFDQLLIDYKKELEEYGDYGRELVKERRETQELDNLNLLYVALTRPETELYIFAKKETPREPLSSYNAFLMAFLTAAGRWEPDKSDYSFGNKSAPNIPEKTSTYAPISVPYIVTTPESHNLNVITASVYDTEDRTIAIGLGNLFHDTMAQIQTANDVETVIRELESLPEEAVLISELKNMIVAVVDHPELNAYFKNPHRVFNEREIATPQKMIRPDRIVIHEDNSATIIDYKTGKHDPKYVEQIYDYADALEAMGHPVHEKLLVYCNPDGIMINKA